MWLIIIPVCGVSFSRGYGDDDDEDDEDDSSDQQEVALPLPQLSLWVEGNYVSSAEFKPLEVLAQALQPIKRQMNDGASS